MTDPDSCLFQASLHRRHLLRLGLALLVTPAALTAPASARKLASAAANRSVPASRASVYLLRGFGNLFSTGLDAIAADLKASGIVTHVESHVAWRQVAKTIIAERQKPGPRPIVLIGHSLGANAIIAIAASLDKFAIPVDYLATFAATAPEPLPKNVRKAVNFYFSHHGWGLPLKAGPGFKGKLDNRDFSDAKDVGHFNIEKQRPLQQEVVRQVIALVK
ncbi:lipase [Ochrobactrum quorumnocens]|uniref:Lipase n=1 Tax=Ochrobactrum quorumnocens TaxID=271865 RepID=A0A5N1JYG8_9HYPH|nr:alpha/beta fold hydrolase [[Ochrobactrum] quorumnocens]KAA9368238.1 lipase [[Ochrobactrum] quorumnocens]